MTRTRPCTRSCTLYTAVFTARVQYAARKRPCTADGHGACSRPVYAAFYRVHARVCGLCIRPSTAVYRLRTGHIHGPFMTRTRRRPPHGRVYSPCRVHGRSRRVRTVYTVHDRVHGRVRVIGGPCTAVYMVRTRPCTRAVNTAVYRVHDLVHGRVRVMDGPCKAVYMVRTRPCTRAVKTAV